MSIERTVAPFLAELETAIAEKTSVNGLDILRRFVIAISKDLAETVFTGFQGPGWTVDQIVAQHQRFSKENADLFRERWLEYGWPVEMADQAADLAAASFAARFAELVSTAQPGGRA